MGKHKRTHNYLIIRSCSTTPIQQQSKMSFNPEQHLMFMKICETTIHHVAQALPHKCRSRSHHLHWTTTPEGICWMLRSAHDWSFTACTTAESIDAQWHTAHTTTWPTCPTGSQPAPAKPLAKHPPPHLVQARKQPKMKPFPLAPLKQPQLSHQANQHNQLNQPLNLPIQIGQGRLCSNRHLSRQSHLCGLQSGQVLPCSLEGCHATWA